MTGAFRRSTYQGFVQKLSIEYGGNACVQLGSSPVDCTLLTVDSSRNDDDATSEHTANIVDALTAAMTARHEVTVFTAEGSASITSFSLGPV